jgi:acetylornithine deacetylase/succinyl-diaminopimelate desuccinylase-like protein
MTNAAIHDYIARNREAAQKFLAELVQTPSDNPPGACATHAERTAVLLEGLGFTVERHVVPHTLVVSQGMISVTNLIVRHTFGPGPTIALNAHGDVVPPGEGWTTEPYGAKIIDGWMVGRGVAVSKSDICTYAFALAALRDTGAKLSGSVELHITYDEETGGKIGPAWLLQQGLTKPDLAIAAGFSYQVVNAHNGCLHLAVTVSGKSAHAAKPFSGNDALEAATAILNTLYATRKTYQAIISSTPGIGSPQLTIGLIKGGINTNVVPDRVTFRLDRRIIPDENPATVEATLTGQIKAAAATFPGISVKIRRILLAAPLTPHPGATRMTEIISAHATTIFGEKITATGVPLYTDARHYAAANIPIVLYGAGPHTIEEANAHRANERLPLADLTRATEVIALSLRDLLQ